MMDETRTEQEFPRLKKFLRLFSRDLQEDFPAESSDIPAEKGLFNHPGWFAAGSMVPVLLLLWMLFRLIPGSLTVNATSSLLHKEARAARASALHDIAAQRYEEAMAIGFRQAVQYRSVRLEYVQALIDAKHREKARDFLVPLAESGDAGVYELIALANLMLESGDTENALKWARQAADRADREKHPAAKAAALGIEGGALLSRRDIETAREKLQVSLKTQPSGDAAVRMARLLYQEGKTAEARSLLQRYLLAGGGPLSREARDLHRTAPAGERSGL